MVVRQYGPTLLTLKPSRLNVEDLCTSHSNYTIALTHVGLTAVHAFDVDWNHGLLVIAGNVAYGESGQMGVPRLGGADVLFLSLTSAEVLWSLERGPFPQSHAKREQLGLGLYDPYCPRYAQQHSKYTISFETTDDDGTLPQASVRTQDRPQDPRPECVRCVFNLCADMRRWY